MSEAPASPSGTTPASPSGTTPASPGGMGKSQGMGKSCSLPALTKNSKQAGLVLNDVLTLQRQGKKEAIQKQMSELKKQREEQVTQLKAEVLQEKEQRVKKREALVSTKKVEEDSLRATVSQAEEVRVKKILDGGGGRNKEFLNRVNKDCTGKDVKRQVAEEEVDKMFKMMASRNTMDMPKEDRKEKYEALQEAFQGGIEKKAGKIKSAVEKQEGDLKKWAARASADMDDDAKKEAVGGFMERLKGDIAKRGIHAG